MESDQSTTLPSLKFTPLMGVIGPGFWQKLYDKKLDTFKLDARPVPIHASYRNDGDPSLPPFINIDYDAFDELRDQELPKGSYPMKGTLVVTNTIEDFKNLQLDQLMQQRKNEIRDIITNWSDNQSSELTSFLLLTFPDLKTYKVYYWMAFPSFLLRPETIKLLESPVPLVQYWSNEEAEKIKDLHSKSSCLPYFIVAKNAEGQVELHPLSQLGELIEKGLIADLLVGFVDPYTGADYAGWNLRNLIVFVALTVRSSAQTQVARINFLSYRLHKNSPSQSLVIKIALDINGILEDANSPKAVGLQKNDEGKLLPRLVKLSEFLDPAKRAENAVNLNLRLMRWRLVPDLNLEKIASTRCLLLGAGTLGCYISRALLAWGVRTITYVDSGKVNDSNPVRQPLYNFDDVGKNKAEAAAEALKRIFPGVNATGHVFSIPMPGHPVPQSMVDSVLKDVDRLENLIETHDAIFLLMDTRESRWLPTLISAEKQKLVINAALGFDTYLVQRHGVRSNETNPSGDASSSQCIGAQTEGPSTSQSSVSQKLGNLPAELLGCYFCNDVVAPGNSLKDRTLDQQCTVTRPGVALLASGLAVELMISVLQHPKGIFAPAVSDINSDYLSKESESILGVVPHCIRGFLSHFHQVMPSCAAFSQCSACSKIVISHYKTEKQDFLLKAFNDPGYLEEVTGLKKLVEDLDHVADIWAVSDDESTGSNVVEGPFERN